MDDVRFDALTRLLARDPSRRGLLASLLAGFALAPQLALAKGKKKQHKKKKKKKKGTPAPTCFDGKKNGNETGIDCGGPCKRCGVGQQCKVANDCGSGTCTAGKCATCTETNPCGTDFYGQCSCDKDFNTQQLVCNGRQLGLTVMSCPECPAGTESCVTINGLLFNCYRHCGSP